MLGGWEGAGVGLLAALLVVECDLGKFLTLQYTFFPSDSEQVHDEVKTNKALIEVQLKGSFELTG